MMVNLHNFTRMNLSEISMKNEKINLFFQNFWNQIFVKNIQISDLMLEVFLHY